MASNTCTDEGPNAKPSAVVLMLHAARKDGMQWQRPALLTLYIAPTAGHRVLAGSQPGVLAAVHVMVEPQCCGHQFWDDHRPAGRALCHFYLLQEPEDKGPAGRAGEAMWHEGNGIGGAMFSTNSMLVLFAQPAWWTMQVR